MSIDYYKEKEIIKKLVKFNDSNQDSLLIYARKIQEIGNDCGKLSGHVSESYYFYKNKKYDTVKTIAYRTLSKCDSLLSKEPNNLCFIKIKINTLNRLFWTYKNLEDYEKAFQYLIKKSDYISSVSNKVLDKTPYLINIDLSKANVKLSLELYEDSKNILKKLLNNIDTLKIDSSKINSKNIFIQRKSSIYNLLGKSYLASYIYKKDDNLADSASYYFKKGFLNAKNFTPPHPDTELIYQFRQTELLIAKKQFREALILINQYPKLTYNDDYLRESFFYKTICFKNLQQEDSAILYAKHALANKTLKKSKLIAIYDILSNEYVQKNQLDSAYKYSKLTLNEFNLARDRKQKTFQLLYDNDIKKINKLNQTILNKEKSKNLKSAAFYFLIILIVSSLFLIKRKKYKKEINQKEEELKVINDNKEKSKVNYNIEVNLENKILEKIQEIEKTHEYLHDNFSINTLAESLNTNSTYISFVFNKHHEKTFTLYYTQKKIEYAVKLLKDDKAYEKYSIEGLAKEVGYKNASAFTRAFKKFMNITPSAYIKNLNK